MAAAADMPEISSGKILQISELDSWSPDEFHSNAVRVLGSTDDIWTTMLSATCRIIMRTHTHSVAVSRVKNLEGQGQRVVIEYHGKQLAVDTKNLRAFGELRQGMLLQFLGELNREHGNVGYWKSRSSASCSISVVGSNLKPLLPLFMRYALEAGTYGKSLS